MSTSSSPPLARRELARLLEQNARAPGTTTADLERYCRQAVDLGFFGVCVNSSRVVQAAHWLDGVDVKVICAIAFPLGAADSDVKRFETEVAVDNGAHLIEVMVDCGRLAGGDEAYVLRELRDVAEAADERPVGMGLNLEELGQNALELSVRVAREAGVRGVSLFGRSAAMLGAVSTIRHCDEQLGIKVELAEVEEFAEFDLARVTQLLSAGAVRFGVRDGSKLMRELP